MRAAWLISMLTVLVAAGRARAAAPGAASAPVVPIAPAAPPAVGGPTAPAAPERAAPPEVSGARQGGPAAAGLIRDPAPRPAPALRVQARYAEKAGRGLVFGGFEYLARGDFFNSPGARLGAAYYPLESLGLELQVSHYWSWLGAEAERVKHTLGAIPDSHAPEWLILAGARYSIGYGKLLVGGMGTAIHFEPQIFTHLGGHVHDGDKGFSSDAGIGLLVFLTPRAFARIDAALVLERERRSGVDVSVLGALPSLSFGGVL